MKRNDDKALAFVTRRLGEIAKERDELDHTLDTLPKNETTVRGKVSKRMQRLNGAKAELVDLQEMLLGD